MSSRSVSEWISGIETELGLSGSVDSEQGLGAVDDLADQVHRCVGTEAVHRTLFLLGVAAGRAEDPAVAAQDAAQKLGAMAGGWNSEAERGEPSNDQSQRA